MEGSRRVRDQKLRLEVFSNPSHDILRPNTVILQRFLPLFQAESTKILLHSTMSISPCRNPEQGEVWGNSNQTRKACHSSASCLRAVMFCVSWPISAQGHRSTGRSHHSEFQYMLAPPFPYWLLTSAFCLQSYISYIVISVSTGLHIFQSFFLPPSSWLSYLFKPSPAISKRTED